MVDDRYSTIGLSAPSEEWIIPITKREIKLRDALENMGRVGGYLRQSDVPLIIKLTENPDYMTARWFGGAVDLFTHDCIHILLGRGMLPKDEAFVIGYTMGSTGKTTDFKEFLFLLIVSWFYPEGYKFYKEEREIFRGARDIAEMSRPSDLSKVDFNELLDLDLKTIRKN